MNSGEGPFVGCRVRDHVHVEGDSEIRDVVFLIGSDDEYEFGADHFEGVGDSCEDEFSSEVDEEFGLVDAESV